MILAPILILTKTQYNSGAPGLHLDQRETTNDKIILTDDEITRPIKITIYGKPCTGIQR